MSTPFSFVLPAELSAKEPPEGDPFGCGLRDGMSIWFSSELNAIVERQDGTSLAI